MLGVVRSPAFHSPSGPLHNPFLCLHIVETASSLFRGCAGGGVRRDLFAEGDAGVFLTDANKAVFVASALEPACKSQGANSLLVWHAIEYCQQHGIRELDFKGSMLAGVEPFILGFHPRPEVYFNITLNRLGIMGNLVYQMQKRARDFVKKFNE